MNQPLQPLSWRELLRINGVRLFGDLRDAWATSSPLTTRAFVAAATLLAALGLWFAGEEWGRLYVFEAMRASMPRWAWALAFTVGGIGQWWRMIDDEPRFIVGLLINGHVAACWLLLGVSLWISGSLVVAAAPLVMAAQAAWIAIRTGATHLDRRRA